MAVGRYKVVVTDHVFADLDIERSRLAEIGAELRQAAGTSESQIEEAARDADGLLVCYAKITRPLIQSLERCRVIARYGIGVDNIDLEAATEKGIPVANVPDYCLDEVSDHTVALLLACARQIPQLDCLVRKGVWDFKPRSPLFRLRGKVLGLLGLGKIARAVAEKARAFGLEVLAYDPYVTGEEADKLGVSLVGWEELLERSDFVSVHVPLTAETKGKLDRSAFQRMKPTAFLINTARGEVVDEIALQEALASGEIAGAGLDVVCGGEPSSGNPLLKMDSTILTPHAAFYSEESMRELRSRAVEEVVRGLTGQPLRSLVNRGVLHGPKGEVA